MPTAKSEINDEVEWNLVDLVRNIISARRLLLVFTLAGLILGVLIAFLWPKWYAAEAVFLPPRATETVGAGLMSAGAGAGAGAAGGNGAAAAALMLQQDPSDVYLGMLGSRSVQDDVIGHLGLMDVYHVKSMAAARVKLKKQSNFKVNKNSFILVDITAKDPKLASSIANAYLDALYRLNGSMVASAASHRSAFFEEQLTVQKNALDTAEVALKQVEEKTGIILPEGAAQADLRTIVELQSSIGTAEAKLSALRTGATEDNPQVVQARAELAALRSQLMKQQANTAKQEHRQGLASTSALPGLAMEIVRKMRDVKINEALYDSLTQQYERSRILSLDPGPQLQIVDHAITSERKAGPFRLLIMVGGLILGLISGLVWIIIRDPLSQFFRACSLDPAAEK